MSASDSDLTPPLSPDLRSIRAVYFDLDDTLCGYWDAAKIGLREAFAAHPVDGMSVEEMAAVWAEAFRGFAPTLKKTGWYPQYLISGEPTRNELMRRMLELMGIDDSARAVALGDLYMRRRDANLELFPDALEILTELHAKYPLGLITNGPADVQRQEVATLGIGHFFQNIYIEGEMGEGKPNRAVFDRAAEAVSCEPHEVLMVGNSFGHDIAAALDAGWRAIWIRRPSDVAPSATKPEEAPEGAPTPDAIVSSLREVADLLAGK